MSLQRKRRGVQIRLAEILGALMLCATVGLGANWFLYQQRAYGWTTTQATVTGAQFPGDTASRNGEPRSGDAIVYYTYSVGGRAYTGSTEPNIVQRALGAILPQLIMRQLNARGIYTFADLPDEVRRMIREGTHYTFNDLPEAERAALEGAGFDNTEELRGVMLAAMEASESKVAAQGQPSTRTVGPTEIRAQRIVPTSATSAVVSVPIIYDPRDPSRSEIVSSTSTATSDIAGLIGLVILAVLTCTYFAIAYPWLKTRGY